MKVVIIGGVAAGTKVAAKLKRENPQDEIVIYTKGKDISYAGCGLPYYIGGSIETEGELIVNTPTKFMKLTGTTVHTESEVVAVDPSKKTISVRNEEIGDCCGSGERCSTRGGDRTSRCIFRAHAKGCHRCQTVCERAQL